MVKAVLNTAKIAALGAITLQVARSVSELTEIAIDKAKKRLERER
jgi:hypothetical protein